MLLFQPKMLGFIGCVRLDLVASRFTSKVLPLYDALTLSQNFFLAF